MSIRNQKAAVTTGASQGMGAAFVAAYRKLGYAVVATSRTIAGPRDADVLTIRGDVSDQITADRVIDAGMDQFGRIDTLINDAGIFTAGPFTDYTKDQFDSVIGVNLPAAAELLASDPTDMG